MAKSREVFDFTSTETGRPMRAVFIPATPGVRFHEKDTVAFYDRTYDFTDDGQFTGASYYVETLKGHTRGVGLVLQGGEPAWNLSGADMIAVLDALDSWDAEERFYTVGVPLVVSVDKYGGVRMVLDASEVADRHFGEDEEEELGEAQVDSDRKRVDSAIRRHVASLEY